MLDWKLCFVSIARKMNKKETSTQNNIDFICAGGFFMNNFRTDMAVERNDIYKKQNSISNDIDGVETEKREEQGIEITKVKITNSEGEKALGKPIGNYITLDVKNVKNVDDEDIEEISEVLAGELRDVINEHIKET